MGGRLPLTSGPVVFFLAIERGSGFATRAALAMLPGTISQAAFALATVLFRSVSLPALPAFALVTASLILA